MNFRWILLSSSPWASVPRTVPIIRWRCVRPGWSGRRRGRRKAPTHAHGIGQEAVEDDGGSFITQIVVLKCLGQHGRRKRERLQAIERCVVVHPHHAYVDDRDQALDQGNRVGLTRIELVTSAVSVLRSNQLSYSPADKSPTIHHPSVITEVDVPAQRTRRLRISLPLRPLRPPGPLLPLRRPRPGSSPGLQWHHGPGWQSPARPCG